MHTEVWWGNLKEGGHLKDTSVDGRIIVKLVDEKLDGKMDWIDLVADDRWRALVNAVIPSGYIKCGEFTD
jgi:hypothetical protein